MALYDRVELLCQAIDAQGKEEAQKIVAQARDRAARSVAEEEERRQEVLNRTKTEVQAQAQVEARNRLDRAELESKRKVAQTKEALLNEIFTQGLRRLQEFRSSPEYRKWLREMLVKVLGQLEGQGFRVAAHPEEARWLTPELLAEVGRENNCRVEFTPDPELPPGGFLAVRADGKVRYDQTFPGIINRQRETLRAELARRLWEGGE
jgi:vacuolar-type H+-ATPase subunit E/Vma4